MTPWPGTMTPMTRHWTPAAVVYLLIAIGGLVATATANALSVVQMRNLVHDWFQGGPAVSSLTYDLLGVAIAAGVLIVLESKRIGMRHAWLLLPLACVTAIAFAFPLFLALRERRLSATPASAADAVRSRA